MFRSTLESGAVVLSERMESVRSVALGFWFRQGRVHEAPEEQGVSHLLEHMVFKGTSRRSALDLVWELERLGGGLDAFTTHESTAFQARVPDSALEPAVDVLADLSFAPALRSRDLEPERQVVLEELASIEESPEDLAFERHASFLYDGHPYGEPIIGSRDSVSALGREALARLHGSAYRPANLVIAAAGRIDHEELLALLERYLPDPGPAARAAEPGPAPGAIGRREVAHVGSRQAHIVAAGMTIPYGDPLRYALVLVTTALGGGMSSRLFQRVREDLGLAYSVYSFHSFFATGGHAGAYVGTAPETVDAARDVMLETLAEAAEQGLPAHELEATKEQTKGRLLLSLESPVARMSRLAALTLYDLPYRTLDQVAERIDGVTEAEAGQAAAFLHPDRLAVLELSPG